MCFYTMCTMISTEERLININCYVMLCYVMLCSTLNIHIRMNKNIKQTYKTNIGKQLKSLPDVILGYTVMMLL